MRILALDSSGLVASVAVVEDGAVDDQVIAEYTVNYKKTHSQTLLPMLDEIVKMTELDLHTVDAIAVAGGPGSFTGLRIGSATAKGLGLALEKPLIHIPTLEGLACNLCGIADVVCPIMDARRGQVYAGIYEFDGQKLHILEDQMAVPIEELGEKLKKYLKEGRRVTFLGDGVPVHKTKIKEEILPGEAVTFAPANMNRQRAASVGTLGMQYYKEGKIETAINAWKTSAHQRSASLKLGAPTGMIMNSCTSTVLAACAPPFNIFIIGTGSLLPFTPPRKR